MAFDVVNRSTFRATAAIAAREAEANQNIPAVAWTNGVNNGSCSAGLGVGYDTPNLVGTDEQFTLLDQGYGGTGGQTPVVRVPQVSQVIGGSGLGAGVEGNGTEFLAAVGNPANNANGTPNNDLGPTTNGTGNLQTLAAGWVPAVI
jgi:hypothetical protein